jgi:hypothetical protein
MDEAIREKLAAFAQISISGGFAGYSSLRVVS